MSIWSSSSTTKCSLSLASPAAANAFFALAQKGQYDLLKTTIGALVEILWASEAMVCVCVCV